MCMIAASGPPATAPSTSSTRRAIRTDPSSSSPCSRAISAPLVSPASSDKLGLGVLDDRLAVLLGPRADASDAIRDLVDVPGDDDLLLHHAHPAELHAEALERLGAAGGLRVGAGHLRHRPQPVQDPPGQP